MNTRSINIALIIFLMTCFSAYQSSAEELKPINKDWAQAFSSMRPDPPPPMLTRNSHYWVSDEKRHDLFRNAIQNKGGVFVGLGTDQNYLMAAWARPEVLIPLDFDQMVVALHYVFRVIFLNADTPERFMEMWSEKEEATTQALIAEEYKDNSISKDILKAFSKGRRRVHSRLKRTVKSYGRLGVPTYLTDKEQYSFVVSLFKTGRVFPIRGDLTATTTVRNVASAARKVGLTIRVLYLSNAEQYFKYSDDYRQNMLSLPYDSESVVIRTAGTKAAWSADGLYDYVVQGADNFCAWLNYPKTFNFWTIVAKRKVDKKTGGSVIEALPPSLQAVK